MRRLSGRARALLILLLAAALLAALAVAGVALGEDALVTDFARKNLPPSPQYPFGTDWMGRDMLARTLSGLSLSIRLGLLTASVSALLAFLLGAVAAVGGKAADRVVSGLTDLMMGVPHILLLILISFAAGKGFRGVMLGILLTHWMTLARVIRGEILQLRRRGFVQVAEKLGWSRGRIVLRHMLPHLLPQFAAGLLLLFPHAILHEATVTFLGFGLPPERPSVGIILSESMRHLSMGRWWLAVFPGVLLVLTVLLFDLAGRTLRQIADPGHAHE